MFAFWQTDCLRHGEGAGRVPVLFHFEGFQQFPVQFDFHFCWLVSGGSGTGDDLEVIHSILLELNSASQSTTGMKASTTFSDGDSAFFVIVLLGDFLPGVAVRSVCKNSFLRDLFRGIQVFLHQQRWQRQDIANVIEAIADIIRREVFRRIKINADQVTNGVVVLTAVQTTNGDASRIDVARAVYSI